MDQSIDDAHLNFQKKARNSPIKEQMEQNEKHYQIQLQVAKYFKLSESYENNRCFSIASNEKADTSIYFIQGNCMPDIANKQDHESMKIDFISTINPQKFFVLVFFNTNLMTGSALTDFKDFYTTLPMMFYKNLQKFIVVHANFIVKSGGLFMQNEYQKFFKKITVYIDNLFDLSKQDWFRYKMLHAMSTQIKQYDQSHKDIDQQAKRTIFLKKQTMEEFEENDEQLNNEDQFNKDSQILGQPLESYPRNINEIPLVLNILIQYFDDKPHQMKTEGLFRKQAAVYEEKILEAALACQKQSFVEKVENAHVVAGVLKQFFIKLPEPIMTFQVYDYVINQIGAANFEKDKEEAIKLIYSQIPPFNYSILIFMLSFILKVTEFKDQNLMTKYNMGVVFGPSFFRSKVLSMADFQNVNLFVSIVNTMLENFTQFFPEYNYQDYLERAQEDFNCSMVPFLPEDAANIDDIIDMIGSNGYLILYLAENAQIVITEVEREQLRSKRRIFPIQKQQ